jgi:amino acid adenylation domain-containing protein
VTRLEALAITAARDRPEATAVRAPDGQLTYGELDALANRFARAFAQLGVRRGDRIAIWLAKSRCAIAATQGALRIGASYVPLDPTGPAARAQLIMEDCKVAAAVVERDGGCIVALRAAGDASIGWDALTALSSEPLPDRPRGEDELAYILYTSGSTGRPKGVCISHRNALAFVGWAATELGLRAQDRLANHAPLHFDLSVFDLYAAFHAGASVCLVPEGAGFAARTLVDFVREQRITVWYSVPSALILMIQRGALLDAELPDLRAVMFAGEPFAIKYVRSLRRRFPELRLLNLYGPTETNVCAFHEVRDVGDDRRTPVPIGRACSGDVIRAVTPRGAEVQVGERGELVVEGPTVMLGYWGRPPQARRPYRTGDIVTRISPDEYQYVGRRDGMVKVRGHRIELGEVEASLMTHADVREAAVVIHTHGGHSRLVASIVAAGARRPSLVEIKRHCAALLPRYMIVDRIRYVNELPKTSTGKLDRRMLELTVKDES